MAMHFADLLKKTVNLSPIATSHDHCTLSASYEKRSGILSATTLGEGQDNVQQRLLPEQLKNMFSHYALMLRFQGVCYKGAFSHFFLSSKPGGKSYGVFQQEYSSYADYCNFLRS